MSQESNFIKVTAKNRNDPNKVLEGIIVERENTYFYLDVEIRCEVFKTFKLSYNKWDLIYDV